MENQSNDFHWQWRLRMARLIASKLDYERFGVEALYVMGSTKNATSGPGSDIDLMAHFRGTPEQEKLLRAWMEGWSLCLAEINRENTGMESDGLIDFHIITDEDIRNRNSYAVKIGAHTDRAWKLDRNSHD